MEEDLARVLGSTVVVATACVLAFFILIIRVLIHLVWKPLQVRRYYEHQGLRGPAPHPIFGNELTLSHMLTQAQSSPMPTLSHDIVHRVIPYYHHWVRIYGKQLLFWYGIKPRLSVAEPELIKKILGDRSGLFAREPVDGKSMSKMLLGGGLPSLSGHTWAKHRKILNPVFHLDRVKGIVPTVCGSCELMLQSWTDSTEVDAQNEFRKLSADVIARTAFGSNYEEGRHIFRLQDQQIVAIVNLIRSGYVPGVSLYIPTKTRRECFRLEKEIRQHIKEVIWAREKKDPDHLSKDLLGTLLAANRDHGKGHLLLEEIVDECKSFYLGGYETTFSLLTWTIILLATHKRWQEKARQEVLQVFPKNVNPDAENINRLHTVSMILNETLRLYPPAIFIIREAAKDTELGSISVRAGTQIFIPVVYVHHNPELWGEDVNEFNPERFGEGAAKAAKHPLSFLPHGFGPMNCIGQNFALLEAKTVLAMILQRFSLDLSPSYCHAPAAIFALRPQYGAQIIVRKI